jgi:hypothetical protein
MTLDEAILALTNARAEVGGGALLRMVDGLHVVKFPIGDGCVYVSDLPQPEEWAHLCDYCRAELVPSKVPLIDDPELVSCPACRAKIDAGQLKESARL